MEKNSIYILGLGHNTPVYIDLVEACGYQVAGLYHYDNTRVGESLHGYKIIGSNDDLFSKTTLEGCSFALSMGDNKIRMMLSDKIRELGGNIPTLIHPSAIIQKFALIESGAVIHANAVIQSDAHIYHDSVISFNVGISHNTTIGRGSYIACQTIVGAYTHIKEGSLIGMGSVIVSGKVPNIGPYSIVGAGSVVISSVEEKCVVAGNPAKTIKIIG